MAGYFGTDQQQTLQRRTHEMRAAIAATPGLYNAGRFVGVDDPDRLPWDTMESMLGRDGLLGLRMISPDQAERCFPRLERLGCRIDVWDILVGGREDAGRRAEAILEQGLPAGIVRLPSPSGPEGADTRSAQRFLAGNGLAPFPGTMLSQRPPLATTVLLGDVGGCVAAMGHVYFPHNAHSAFSAHAWIGLVAVAEGWRGRGLGRLVCALLVRSGFAELGARRVYAMVAPPNRASRRMVEGCGLRPAVDLRCGVAQPADRTRFTR